MSVGSVAGRHAAGSLQGYFQLCKPRVVALITFTAVVGMFLSTSGFPPLSALVFGTLGIALGAASGAALNHVADRHIDALMARTSGRPPARGRTAPPGAGQCPPRAGAGRWCAPSARRCGGPRHG